MNKKKKTAKKAVVKRAGGDTVQPMSVGLRIRLERTRRGWKQGDLALRLETSQPHVSRIEGDVQELSLPVARRLMRVFGWTDLQQVFGKEPVGA